MSKKDNILDGLIRAHCPSAYLYVSVFVVVIVKYLKQLRVVINLFLCAIVSCFVRGNCCLLFSFHSVVILILGSVLVSSVHNDPMDWRARVRRYCWHEWLVW